MRTAVRIYKANYSIKIIVDKFEDKYRIESHRLFGYDYSGNGIYFITLVLNGRECILGEIKDDKMHLSEWGSIIKEEWLKSFELRKELGLDEYVIMPNHLHGLVIIRNVTPEGKNLVDKHDQNVETYGRTSLQEPYNEIQNFISWQKEPIPAEFRRKPKSISSFIAGFKAASTSAVDNFIDKKELDIPKYNKDNKLWQANYHDRVIRNEKEYWKIKQYIKSNPKNWESDDLNV